MTNIIGCRSLPGSAVILSGWDKSMVASCIIFHYICIGGPLTYICIHNCLRTNNRTVIFLLHILVISMMDVLSIQLLSKWLRLLIHFDWRFLSIFYYCCPYVSFLYEIIWMRWFWWCHQPRRVCIKGITHGHHASMEASHLSI